MLIKILFLGALYTIKVIADPTIISQSFKGNDFNNGDGWNVINAQSGISICSGIKMFGGQNLFGRDASALKQFDFPPHSIVYLKVTFYQIHSWDYELFQIWLDDKLVFKEYYSWSQATNSCGTGLSYNTYQITLKLKHTGPTGIVIFASSLDEAANNEAWGIRDFEISVEKCPESCYACQEGDTAEACKVWIIDQIYWASKIDNQLLKEDWTVTGGQGFSNCGGIALFGGFQKFGVGAKATRTFFLRPHYRLKIKFMFAKIDSWDNENAVLKAVDGAELWKRVFRLQEGIQVNICGKSNFEWRELFTRVEVDIAHSRDQATIEITTNLDQVPIDESWGIRDFYLYYATCSPNCIKCTGPLPKDCTFESSFWDDQFTSLENWILFGNQLGNLNYDCDGKTLVGGYKSLVRGAIATKAFSLPKHKKIRLMLKIYKLDSWDNEWLIIKFNGVEVWKRSYTIVTGSFNLCGNALSNDCIEQVDEIILHTQTQLEIQLSSNLSADDESWGFREFKLFYQPAEECVILYTECDYKGTTFDFCVNSANFQKDSVPPIIRSIKVPPYHKITLYENPDYKGNKVSFTTNQNCINSIGFSFSQQSGSIEFEK